MKNRNSLIGLGILFLAVLITYSNHFHNSFHFDDSHTIQNNIYLRSLKNIPLFFKDGATISSLPSNQSYRPVLTTSLAIDYWLGKGLEDTFVFHVTSFLLFLGIGLMMFLITENLFNKAIYQPSRNNYVALLAVAFFMLHPVCAETVNYIIQRGDIFAAFFTALGLLMYMLSPVSKRYYIYVIPVFIGILAKPNTLMFGPILLLFIYLFEHELGVKNIFHFNKLSKVLVSSIAGLSVCVFGYIIINIFQSETFVPGGSSAFKYIISQPFMLMYYFSAWFAPVHLNADTDWIPFNSIFEAEVIFGFLFLAFIVAASVIASNYKSTRPIAFGLLWFIVANVPTSLIPFAEVMNDHRMFYPFVGLTIAVIWSVYLIFHHLSKIVDTTVSLKYFLFGSLLTVFFALAYGTYQRNEVWKTEETLWKDCAEKSPGNGRALMNYGLAFMGRADYKNAEIYFTRSLEVWPYYSYQHVNMAILKNAMGKANEAESYFLNAIKYGSGIPNSYFFYARWLNQQNRKPEALIQLEKCLQISKANPDARFLLMDILFETGQLDKLKLVCNETLQIIPDNEKAKQYLLAAQSGKSKMDVAEDIAAASNKPVDYLNLSLQYYLIGDYQECIDAANKALSLKPNYAEAYNNIGSAYNMLGKFEEGRAALLKALEIDPNNQLSKNNLAWAEGELKKKSK
jgi:tetratricopeptide (TPR) repeat protein